MVFDSVILVFIDINIDVFEVEVGIVEVISLKE